jgi:hypothetical protein
MLLTPRTLPCIFAFTALALVALAGLAQAPPTPANPSISPEPGAQPACPPMANIAIPSRAAIEAKVTGLDSAHLKPGKDIWFKLARPFSYPGCALDADSVVYARVISVSPSEISLSFDRADCNHRDQQPLNLRVIAIVGPPGESHHMHEDMPTEVAGGVRQIGEAVYATSALDENLNPGGAPHTIHPGIVVGVKDLKLQPTAGPQCSDKISTNGNRIQLASGSELILAMTVTRTIKKPVAPSPHP